ncbi:hypothetical protein SAPIO_CDS3082 [Scedosporium apiospermum]|uniref:Uncharacterized protein n=1 Tax=Pseudallescheria apiosperma TaxID=563466 RepID=A0A084G9Z6_PSEDA|nr:uncharacterized protein SAPIO_CDS3082 [Scedosporium apiospermum]KEZ44158.1 hypothetical protein SAPIO_CDS3082 [Scedosporium apiospermum]
MPTTIPLGTIKPIYADDRRGQPPQLKRDIYLDIGDVDDSASETAFSTTTDSQASTAPTTNSASSGGGRRRRRRKRKAASTGGENGGKPGNGAQLAKSLATPAPVPNLGNAKSRSARLHIGLNLDVELELKAKLQGDVCLTLLAESKQSPRPSPPFNPDADGNVEHELFHAHIGTIQLRQHWLQREISPSLTAAVMVLLVTGGFFLGVLAPHLVALIPEFTVPRFGLSWTVPWSDWV